MAGKRVAEMTRAERRRNRERDKARKRLERAAAAGDRAARRELTRILVLPDLHAPYHDPIAWQTALEVARLMNPDVCVGIGDFADCYAVSSHPKDPRRKLHHEEELARARAEADQLEACEVERVIFCEGNHETRIARYVAAKCPELFGAVPEAREALEIDRRGWEWVPYNQWISIGEMSFTHTVGRVGQNTARQSVQDFGSNITVGHSHYASVIYVGTVEGKPHVGLNVGWLGDYSAIDYRHQAKARRDWQHGIGWITQTPDGVSWCQFVPIIGGRCVVDGRLISGRSVAA